VLALFRDGWLGYANVGDSRLYRLRDGRLTQLTKDDSFIQEVVDSGIYPSLEEARRRGVRENILTKAVGLEPDLAVACAIEDLAPGDLFLLCSDGLSTMLSSERIAAVLEDAADGLEAAADDLLAAACEAGGLDNISLVLASVRRQPA
jgi:protein phosphatase